MYYAYALTPCYSHILANTIPLLEKCSYTYHMRFKEKDPRHVTKNELSWELFVKLTSFKVDFFYMLKNILLYLQNLAFDRTCLLTSRELNSDTLVDLVIPSLGCKNCIQIIVIIIVCECGWSSWYVKHALERMMRLV